MNNTYQLLTPLSEKEYNALKDSIEKDGVLVPIEKDGEGNVLDGHHRVQICEEIGIEDYPVNIKTGFESDEEKRTYIRKINLARRHLNQEAKTELIKGQLKDTPEKSNRQIARMLGVYPKTVIKYREELEESVKIPHFSKYEDPRTGKLSQPATKKTITTKTKKDERLAQEITSKAKSGDETAQEEIDKLNKGKSDIRSSFTKIRHEENKKKRERQKEEIKNIEPPEGKYRTIVIDPPWPMKKINRKTAPEQTGFDYPTMSIEEIKDFPVNEVAMKESQAYLWTTQKYLPEAFKILEEWGFKYIFTMVWHKNGGFQPFNLPQYNCEFVLFGRQGGVGFEDTKSFFTCFNADRTGHSRKPDEFYNLVKRVSPTPRINIFSREERDGFDSYGNGL